MNKRKIRIVAILLCIVLLSGCGITKREKLSLGSNQTVSPTIKPTMTPEITVKPIETPLPPKVQKLMDKVTDTNNWKTTKGEYGYPITGNDLACMDTEEDRWLACQIPTEIIKSATTEELLKLVLDCPILHHLSFWGKSWYEGIMEAANEVPYNGMQELISRQDFYKTVVTFYKHMKIPNTKECHLDKVLPKNPTSKDYEKSVEDDALMEKLDRDMKVIDTICFCEAVLTTMTDDVTAPTLKAAQKVLKKKIPEVEKTEYYEEVKAYRWGLKENSLADKRMLADF